ncbi:MAG: c-type cytochrome [Acidimicrobiia bacterium]|nr:c-type cytochrome [Acidimicrobiia bacterium]
MLGRYVPTRNPPGESSARRPPGSRRRARCQQWVGTVAVIAAIGIAAIAWPAQTAAQEPEAVQRGEELYQANCAMCHGADATGMMGMHPALTGVVDRLSLEGVEVTIRNGRNTTPPMPAFDATLTDDEIADVLAYLDALPPGPRNFGPRMTDRDMMDEGMMDRMMDGTMWPWMLLWLAVGLVLLILAVVAIVWLVRRSNSDASGSGHRDGRPGGSAREALDLRYARGEIDRDAYVQARRDLGEPTA